jgi:hypothetical protein
MTQLSKEEGVILTLIERFEKQRLPRLLELKEKSDTGECLSEVDIAFLDSVIQDAQNSKHLIDRHPEWQIFCAKSGTAGDKLHGKCLAAVSSNSECTD